MKERKQPQNISAFLTNDKKKKFNQRVLCITHAMLPIDFFHVERTKGRNSRAARSFGGRTEMAPRSQTPRSPPVLPARISSALSAVCASTWEKVGFVVSGLCLALFSSWFDWD